MANIVVSEEEIKQRLGVLSSQSGKVLARAVNASIPTAKKAVVNETKRRYYVNTSEINKILKTRKAYKDNPTAQLEYTGGHRNLYLWNNSNAVAPKTVIHWSRGYLWKKDNKKSWVHPKANVEVYSAAVMRGGGKHKLREDPKPFVQRVRKGERSDFVGLFRRQSDDKNAKLEGVGAPAIPQIIKNDSVIKAFEFKTSEMLEKRVEHEIDVVLKGIVK